MKNLFITTMLIVSTNLLSQTYVPDDNFEQALIDQGYDSGPLDDYVPTANINVITLLNIAELNISDLTGIEDFTALETLYCWTNNIATLSTSGNPNLVALAVGENQITELNLSSNPNLEFLSVVLNLGLNSIDVSANTQLKELYAHTTSLSSLDVSTNINLENLEISNTFLTEIDLSSNVNLETLGSSDAPGITSLDLSTCTSFRRLMHVNGSLDTLIFPEINTIEWIVVQENNLTTVDFLPTTNNLEILWMQGNQITEMDFSSRGVIFWLEADDNEVTFFDIRDTEVTAMSILENPELTCVFVDDAAWASSYEEYAIDSTSTFVETEAECEALSVQDNAFSNAITIYPNPTNGIININTIDTSIIKKAAVFNSLGQLVLDNQDTKTIDISTFTNGVYFVNLELRNGGMKTIKVLKK